MREARLIEALFFMPSQPKFAQLKSSFNTCTASTEDGGVFEVRLSINTMGNGRSGLG